MTLTRISDGTCHSSGTTATAYTKTLGVAALAGDLIIVSGDSNGTHAANGMSVKDSVNNVNFTTILEQDLSGGSSRWLQTFAYQTPVDLASGTTITFTPYAANTASSFSLDIFRGATSTTDTGPLGQSPASGTTSLTSALSPVPKAGSLVLSFASFSSGTLTDGSPMTTGTADATGPSTAVGYVLGADGTTNYQNTWTSTVTNSNANVVVAFLPSVASSAVPFVSGPSAAPLSPLATGRLVAQAFAGLIGGTPAAPSSPVFVAPFIGARRPAVVRQPRGRFWQVPPAAGSTPCTPPAFGSIGTLHGATTSTPAFAVPSGVADKDIIVCAFFADVSTTTVTGFPAGFQHAEGSPRTVNAGGANNHVLNVCWKRATGADTGSYTFTLSAAVFVYGNAVRYTGGQTTGNPWDSPTSAADGGSANTNTTPAVSISTAGGNRLLFFAGSNWNGDGGTWSAPSGFAQRQGGVNASDIEISDLVQVTQGSSGTVQASDTHAGQSGAWLGALIGTCPTVAVPPALISPTRRSNGLTRPARGKLWTVPPTVVMAPSTAVPTPAFVVNSRRTSVSVARGKFWSRLATPQSVVPKFVIRTARPVSARSRGQFFVTPGAASQMAPRTTGRAVRPVMTRRGEFFSVPTTSVAVMPPRVRLAIHWPGLVRHGRIFPAPTAAVVVGQTGPVVSKTTRLAIHWPSLIRRGRIFAAPTPAIVVPTGPVIPKTLRLAIHWPGPTRRGVISHVPVPVITAFQTGPVIPKTVRLAIHWPGPIRRGRFFPSMPSSQAATPLVTVLPRMIQQHQQTRILTRRGRISPVIGGQPGWVPSPTAPGSRVGARTTRPGTTGRGRIWITPTTPTGPIPRLPIGSTRRTVAVRPPRGRFFPCMPSTQAVPPPPKYVARIMRAATRSWFFARRGDLQFTRLTGAFGFPAEFASSSSGLGMISAGSAVDLHTTDAGSAEFMDSDQGVTFADGSSGTEMRLGP